MRETSLFEMRSPSDSTTYVLPNTDAEKPAPYALDAASLEAEMRAEAAREELGGLRFSAWNALRGDDESATVSVYCGSSLTPWVTSTATVTFPQSWRFDPHGAEIDRYRKLLALSVAIWAPKHAFVIAHRHLDAILEDNRTGPGDPVIGWLTYLDRAPDHVSSLDPPSWVEVMGNGSLIALIADPTKLDADELARLSLAIAEIVL
jgi:hypothetical protein